MPLAISRRTFAGAVGAAAGAALLDSPLVRRTAEAAIGRRAQPLGAVLLNSNENPYGPSAKALERRLGGDDAPVGAAEAISRRARGGGPRRERPSRRVSRRRRRSSWTRPITISWRTRATGARAS